MKKNSPRFKSASIQIVLLGASALLQVLLLYQICLAQDPIEALASQRMSLQSNQDKNGWKLIAPDLELLEFAGTGSLLSGPMIFVRSALKNYHIGVVRAVEFGTLRSEVKALCRLSRASVCINASFFDETGSPLGLIVSRGSIVNPIHRQGGTLTAIFEVTRHKMSIIPRSTFKVTSNVIEAIQAGPRLVVNGNRVTGLKDMNRSGRSIVCLDASDRVIFGSISSGFRGLTFEELQEILLNSTIGCINALNLDGGGSAQMFVAPKGSSQPNSVTVVSVNGFDTIPVALALFPK